MFEFLKQERLLTEEDLHEKTEYLVDDFIVKCGITMWYAREGEGKTWFSLALTRYILDHHRIKLFIYMDMDNPKHNIATRGIDQLMEKYRNLKVIHRSKIDVSPHELLLEIGKEAYGNNYADCVLLFDSTRDFVDRDMHNDTKVREMMSILKNIRDAGGTVLLNSHATKNGKGLDGSGEFAKSLDSLYRLKQIGKSDGVIHYHLPYEKERSAISDQYFSVIVSTLTLGDIDPVIAGMNADDKEFVATVREELAKHGDGINQTKLLETLGYAKADKKARARLESFAPMFWKVRDGSNRQKIFSLEEKEETQETPETLPVSGA